MVVDTVSNDDMLKSRKEVFCERGTITKTHLYNFDPPLRKQAYSNRLKILPPKTENFQGKNI